MRKSVYAVKDIVSMDFESPFVATSDLDVMRLVSTQIEAENSKYEKGLIDYNPKLQHDSRALYYLCDYENGIFINIPESPVRIGLLSELPQLYQNTLTEYQKDL